MSQSAASDPYTNPDELFDVLDSRGNPTGRTKRRADVHRDGDWHRAFHCWVLDESDPAAPYLLYQRRGAHKDTWPSKLDVTVGGHYAHGETLRDVVREVEEEIGRVVGLEDLAHLGTRVAVGGMEDGVNDREIQDIYLWRSAAPLEVYRPQPVEVTALERVALADALALLTGAAERIASRVLLPTGEQRQGWLTGEYFVPTLDRYFLRVAVAADLAARGYPYLVV
ncbi:MAG TPA: NUDIX domain-containing protein [Chloroflexota bacterium]|nr:NUDIX domain-containing protein [Chloroflexota bacterium]